MKLHTRMILDVDTGIDDALAILLALLSPDIKVEGLTTGHGNINADQATENTLRLIQLANCGYEVPVAKGADKPLEREYDGGVPHIHGSNGIGDAIIPETRQRPVTETAAQFIVRTVNENPGEITLVTVGRLTNLALALKLDPSIGSKCKKVIVMGGNVYVPGNATPLSEANLHGDPEAAAFVFASNAHITVVGLDISQQTRLTQAHLDLLNRQATEKNRDIIQFLNDSLDIYFDFYEQSNQFIRECPMHDPLAVLVAINPSLVKVEKLNAVIDTTSELNAGMIVTDRRVRSTVGRPINFCVDVDSARAMNELLSVFNAKGR